MKQLSCTAKTRYKFLDENFENFLREKITNCRLLPITPAINEIIIK